MSDNKTELFFPYYVNQGRLLDLYAILNGGYSEYEEVTTAITDSKIKSGEMKISGNAGFKIFNFGISAEGIKNVGKESSDETKERKVQTVTSVLSIVKSKLKDKQYIHDILEASPGDFIRMPVTLSINSIKYLMDEVSEIMGLLNGLSKGGINVEGISKNDTKEWSSIIKSMKIMFSGEEMLYETENYAVIGNINDTHLYQAVRADLVGTEMKCLAQVKRVFPEGTELMKNTIFSKLTDDRAKIEFINSMEELANGESFKFEAKAVSSIEGKPVYQLEIIALYQ